MLVDRVAGLFLALSFPLLLLFYLAVLLYRELFNDRLHDILKAEFILPIKSLVSTLLHFESLLNIVQFVETLKFRDDFSEDWFTVANKEVQDLLVFFNIVCLLLTNIELFLSRSFLVTSLVCWGWFGLFGNICSLFVFLLKLLDIANA